MPENTEIQSNSANGAENPEVIRLNEALTEFHTLTGLIQRIQLGHLAGLQYGGERDLYKVFGYKQVITPELVLAKYSRQDIAGRIVDAPPGATWSNPPTLVAKNSIVTKWDQFVKSTKYWSNVYMADRLARMAPYSLLLFGFNDTGKLEQPVSTRRRNNSVLYLRPISARIVEEISYVEDNKNPRFGLPEIYKVKFEDPSVLKSTRASQTLSAMKPLSIHHSRVVHIVENPLEDPIHGIPIMEKVYNLLDDLLKIGGGTAETYWLSGRQGLQADVDKDMTIEPADAAALADEITEYMHQLRRFIKTRGVKLNPLKSDVPTPDGVFEMIISLLSGSTGIPKRILLGSEAGQLASEQDRANWAERIEERRVLFANPYILDPTVLLLQNVGILPKGDVEYEWPDAFVQNPLERGQTMAQIARAVGNLSRQTGNKAPMQITSRKEAREVIGLVGDLPESEIIEQPIDEPPQGPPVDTGTQEGSPATDGDTED